jgi:hypothetical protein
MIFHLIAATGLAVNLLQGAIRGYFQFAEHAKPLKWLE